MTDARPETRAETRKVDIGDTELHVEMIGDGPPLMLLAGLGGRGAFWRNQLEAFSSSYRLIVPDHRGCGGSTRGECATDIAGMADDFIALMDVLDLDRVSLVGHSTGGAIGQHLAIHHSERIERLVISSSWAGPDPYFNALFRNRRAVLQACGAEAYLWQGTMLATPSTYLQPMMQSGFDPVSDRLAELPGLEVELSRIDAVMGHDLRARLGEITLPTLCVAALDDQITPPGLTEELAAGIPGAELHLFDRGGHFCPATATKEYNARVGAFLHL